MNPQSKTHLLGMIIKLHEFTTEANKINVDDWTKLLLAIKRSERMRKIIQAAELGNIFLMILEIRTLLEEVIND